jgi:acetolactate synthase-1/2/3 large subunit
LSKINAGKAIARQLHDYGVKYIFGLPGGETLSLYDGIREFQPDMSHILVRDERNGAFMAEGYARFSYRPGVCDGSVGPGTLNMLTGIAEAYYSSTPVVALAGDVATAFVGRNPAHECDQMSIFKPIIKWGKRIERADKVPDAVRKAFRIATSGRPGPVLLDFPEDVMLSGAVDQDDLFIEEDCRVYPSTRYSPDQARVREAVDLLLRSERPVMFVGGGAIISQAYDEVLNLATLLAMPVATAMMGKGVISETHPLSVGTPGTYGSRFANDVVRSADLVLVVGSRLTDYDTAKYSVPRANQTIIKIDVDPNEIGKNYTARVALVGDAKLTLQAIISVLREKTGKRDTSLEQMPRVKELSKLRKDWLDMIAPKVNSEKFPCSPHRIIKEIRKYLSDQDIFVADASTAGLWSAMLYQIPRAGRYYTVPRGIAAIGYSFPAAIGAKLAVPNRKVLSFIGDGGFGLSLTELDTAATTNTQVIVVVHNNYSLGFIKFGQNAMFGGRTVSVDYRKELDYGRIAEAYGCFGRRVEKPGEIVDALREAEQSGKPSVIDIPEDQSELVPPLTLG